MNRYGFKYLNQYPKERSAEILNSDEYFKFVVVRHPFDRLVSAFNDKFINIKYRPDIIARIKRRFHTGGDVTFEEFVSFLSDSYEIGSDMHWEKYENICRPCSVKYDFILKLETVKQDLPELLRNLFRDDTYNKMSINYLPMMNKSKNSSSPSVSKELGKFRSVSSNISQKLYNEYRLDFDLFGYLFDISNSLAQCGGTFNSDSCC